MSILDYAIILFLVMESANVFILYFAPGFKYGNGVSVFKAWEDSKKSEEMHLFAKYLKNWVAGTKLIFITILIVILVLADPALKVYAVGVVVLSIATYFFGLHPIMVKLDKMGQIVPKGYSKTLLFMIIGFIVMFATSLVIYFVV